MAASAWIRACRRFATLLSGTNSQMGHTFIAVISTLLLAISSPSNLTDSSHVVSISESISSFEKKVRLTSLSSVLTSPPIASTWHLQSRSIW